ncbi:MAG: hypothetical protein IKD78_04580 [Bacteroidales bacterium]|nr:hypothetical protein [Bacteroidales bacterium]
MNKTLYTAIFYSTTDNGISVSIYSTYDKAVDHILDTYRELGYPAEVIKDCEKCLREERNPWFNTEAEEIAFVEPAEMKED